MSKYYYSKYTVYSGKPYTKLISSSTFSASSTYNRDCYPSISFDANKGILPSGTPVKITSTSKPPNGYYELNDINSDGGYDSAYKVEDNSSWNQNSDEWTDIIYSIVYTNKTLAKGTLVQSGIVAEDGTYPTNGKHTDGYWYVRETAVNNAPIVTLNTADNTTLYENSTYTIDGQVIDTDNGNIVNVKYHLDGGTIRAIATGISNGSTPITFSKQLTFKSGKLFDGDTAITDALTEGTAHQLKVWAEDDQGGKSAEQIRSFYVVPNRAPSLTINTPQPSGTINNDKFTISGTCSDIDGNDVVVTYRINSGLSTEIYRGAGADFTFDVTLGELVVGSNAIVVEVSDTYAFKSAKTIKLAKAEVKAPVLSSIARYKVAPPKGSAKGVIAWIQRQPALAVEASISAVLAGEQEQYVAMVKTNTAPVSTNIVEDEFTFEASDAKDDITIKLELKRESTTVSDAITLITGVLS